jgi:membrane protease subunit HflC
MNKLFIVLAVLVALLLLNSVYVVKESEQVIITQFGKPTGDPVLMPGLKFKLPFIQHVHRFEKRFLEWDGDPNQLPTRDKRFIWVNMYARWRITDPLLYFQRLRDERGALTRLDDILDGETRNAIANYDLVEVVRSTNREPMATEVDSDDEVTMEDIESGRDVIRQRA